MNNNYLKVVDSDIDGGSGEGAMIACADWISWVNGFKPRFFPDLRSRMPLGMNVDFTIISSEAINAMRNRVLQGKRCFCK